MITCLRFVTMALALSAACPALAQTFPDRPVKLIVPTAAGGAIDLVGRSVAHELSIIWGKQAIVENRPGAAMAIGATAVARATPDGYTLLVAHDGVVAMAPAYANNLSYDAARDFAPVSVVASLPLAVYVPTSLSVKNIAELIAYAKASPGKLNHGSGGPASLLSFELFKSMAGVQIVNVPFRGAALAVNELMAGNIQLVIADVASAAPAIQSPQVRTLAATTMKRLSMYPEWPTVDESGLKGYETSSWIGVFAPAKVPQDILQKLEADVIAATRTQGLRKRLGELGMEVEGMSSSQVSQLVAADFAKWSKLIREQNIQIAQ